MFPARSLERLIPRIFIFILLFAFVLTASPLGNQTAHAQSSAPGIKTDYAVYPEPALPTLPRAGGKYTDPVFGSEIMRVTDEADGPAPGLGTYYSHWPTFNLNNTRLLIRKGDSGDAIVKNFDPEKFELLPGTLRLPATIPGGGGTPTWESATWSHTDADIIYTFPNYYDGGMKLYAYNVRTGVFTLLHDFSALSGGRDHFRQMYVSADDDVFCWLQYRAGENQGEPVAYVVYRRSTDRVLYHNPATIYQGGVNEVHVDKSGKWLHVVIPTPQADGTGTRFLNLETGEYQILRREVDHPPGHGDLGTGVIVGYDNYLDGISWRRLESVHTYNQVLTFRSESGALDWTNDFHGSLLADDESWMTVGTFDDPQMTLPESGVFEDEILQVALDGSQRVRRLCHTRSSIDHRTETTGYWAMPKPTISRDGRYIAFTSNWENSGRYDLFVLKVMPPTPVSVNPPARTIRKPAVRPRRVRTN